jgi:hypothetical protein
MEKVTIELTWKEYQLLSNCIRHAVNTVMEQNSHPELLTEIEELSNKVYISRKIVKDKSGI